jgi:hypothetical protein
MNDIRDRLQEHFPPEFIESGEWKLPADDALYLIMAVRKRTQAGS